ncbi:efflux RND transporter periplasmic adaptor subunit [Candidatus Parcubacteria bacterium]|nr:efflux RND transporter periplasmic adaptor subunit [Candidatus Parcubacteria bacterium]
MKTYLSKLAFLKRKRVFIPLAVLIVGGAIFAFGRGGNEQTFVQAEMGSIEEEVLVTGKTKSLATVDLGFEVSGRVVRAQGEVGTRVHEGETLVVLSQGTLLAERAKAEANLNEELVKLNSTKLTSSASFENAEDNLRAAISDAYAKADNAVRNNIDKFYSNPGTYYSTFDLSFKDGGTTYYFDVNSETARNLSNERHDIEKILQTWQTSLGKISTADLQTLARDSQSNLERIRTFLDHVAAAVNQITAYDFQYESTVADYKTTASAARSEVATSLTNLISALGKLKNVPVTGVSGGTVYNDVLSSEARLDSLKADLAAINANLEKTVLSAPISGVITKAEAKVGEIVTAGTSLVSIIGDKLQVEANVSEVNIGRVRIGNEVSITLDAFPTKEFLGKVSYIDPGETLVDGVATYKVTVNFIDALPEDIRSGLTANLKISTAKKDSVVKVPAYAVEKRNDKSFVMIKTAEDTESREVVTGLRGKDGSIEVVSGLTGGETLLVPKLK